MDEKSLIIPQIILIAEDEPLVLKMLSYRLQKEGYVVLTAIDGREALACLRATSPDLVITDLMMPHHSGLEIVDYVKRFKTPSIPVIVLSASGQESAVQEAFRLGANEFTVKPFTPNELIAQVRKYLG